MDEHDISMTGNPSSEFGSVVPIPTKRLKATVLWASVIVWGFGTFRIIWLELFGRNTFLRSLYKFDLDSDLTIPSWYSSMILGAAALLLFLIAAASKNRDPKNVLHWAFLGVIFTYLSADEGVAIHEMALPFAQKFGLSGVLTFAWLIAAIPFTIITGMAYIPFLLRIPREIAIKLFLAGVIYITGIIGMGMVSGALFSTLEHHKSFVFSLLAAVEEGMEICGVTIFIVALLDHLAKNFPAMSFYFMHTRTNSPSSK